MGLQIGFQVVEVFIVCGSETVKEDDLADMSECLAA